MTQKPSSSLQFNNLTYNKRQAHYRLPPSIANYLPWVEYDSESNCFLLHDKTIAAVFELTDVPSEIKPESQLIQLRDGLQGLFQDTFPQYYNEQSLWIIQFYLQDEPSLEHLYQSTAQYIKPTAKDSIYTQQYGSLTETVGKARKGSKKDMIY